MKRKCNHVKIAFKISHRYESNISNTKDHISKRVDITALREVLELWPNSVLRVS